MATLVTKNSSTAAAVPLAANLVKGELAVNVTDKKLYSKDNSGAVVKLVGSLGNQEADAVVITGGSLNGIAVGNTTPSTGSFTTLVASGASTLQGVSATTLTTSGAVTHNAGTANGVAYLNGSKVLTTGSALTYNGVNLTFGNAGGQAIFARALDSALSGIVGSRSGTDFSLYNLGGTTSEFIAGANELKFNVAASEAMRLTSTGLGIGTSSPAQKLHVVGTGRFNSMEIGANNSDINNANLNPIRFTIQGNAVATLDSSGNLGLGVTPSAWSSSSKVIQNGTLAWETIGGNLLLGTNYYRDSGNTLRYINSAFASVYTQQNSQHLWFTAPSGTAGNPISLTQAMTLDAGGNQLLGATSPLYGTSGRVQLAVNGPSTSLISLSHGGLASQSGALYWDGGALQLFNNSTSGPLIFGAGSGAERARITSTGQLLVGTATAASGAFVDLTSTTGTLVVPRMTTTQRDAISAPANGSVIYNTTTNKFNFRENGVWVQPTVTAA